MGCAGRYGPLESSLDMLAGLTPKGVCTGIVMVILSLSMAACGVRGALDPPPKAKAEGTAKSAEAADPGPDSAAPRKPHEGFILDPLLR